MNTTQSQNFNQANPPAPNLEMFGKKLHDLGDKIERIAEKLKAKGQAEGEELYQLGDEVEHFCDQLKSANSSTAASTWEAPGAKAAPATPKADEISTAQKNSSSTVNSNQTSG